MLESRPTPSSPRNRLGAKQLVSIYGNKPFESLVIGSSKWPAKWFCPSLVLQGGIQILKSLSRLRDLT